MSNELVTIEQQKPTLLESIKALFYRIGNGDKKVKNGPIADINKITERIIKSDGPALEKRNQTDAVSFAKEMEETYGKLVVGKTSRADTQMFEEVTLSKIAGEQKAKLSVIANLSKNQKISVLNKGKEALQKEDSLEKQQTQVEKNMEDERQ